MLYQGNLALLNPARDIIQKGKLIRGAHDEALGNKVRHPNVSAAFLILNPQQCRRIDPGHKIIISRSI